MPNIIVYSKKDCPNCDMLKGLLTKENIEYKMVKIDTPAALTELRLNDVYTTLAPVLQVDNTFYTLNDMASPNKSSKDAAMLIIDQGKVMDIIGKWK